MLDAVALRNDYLGRGNRENASNTFSAAGLSNYMAESASKEMWRAVYPEKAVKAHDAGAIHIHDMGGGLKPYCGGFSARKILSTGLTGAPGLPAARPPRHFHSAVDQLTNFMGLAAQELAGAVALADFDVALAPFVRADGLSKEDLKETLVSMVYTLNMPTRFGSTPFTNLGLAPGMPAAVAEDPVIIADEYMDCVYSELEPERLMVAEALLEILLEGQADGREFTFPIISIMVDPDTFPWDSEYARLAGEIAAKYGNDNFLNMGPKSPYNMEDAFSSCCRLAIDTSKLRGSAGSFMALPETGAQGVVTINLNYIAAECGVTGWVADKYLSILDRYLDVSFEALREKRAWLESNWSLYPVIGTQLENLDNHFDVIGIIGGAEALRTMFREDVRVYDTEGNFILRQIVHHILDRIDEQPGLVGLEYPPCEGATGRLARATKKRFPEAFVRGDSPDEYYLTPAVYIPGDEWEDLHITEVLENQSPLHAMATSGTALHVYAESPSMDGVDVMAWIKKVFAHYSVPHLTWNPAHSVCRGGCGYIKGHVDECPTCGGSVAQMIRVLGFSSEVIKMNKSKQAEARDRYYQ